MNEYRTTIIRKLRLQRLLLLGWLVASLVYIGCLQVKIANLAREKATLVLSRTPVEEVQPCREWGEEDCNE